MKISIKGITLLQKWEGCRLRAYQDGGGVWTIGWGHTSVAGPPEVTKGMIITQEEADAILRKDLEHYEAGVSARIGDSPITQTQFDAMVVLCYNIGVGAFKGSTVAREHVNKRYSVAADAFLKWNKDNGKVVRGLTNRREAERSLYMEKDNG
jgi:lysozyme